MILGWWRDWRERRSALGELRGIVRDKETQLLDQHDNPLRQAADLVSRNLLADAAAQWELAKILLPNAILRTNDVLDILYALKRYDEAEAMMRARQIRYPRDRFPLEGLARIAELRGDTEEALKRWQAYRDRTTERANGYYGCARCLLALGRLDEAEREAELSIRRTADALDGWVVRGVVSERRGDWEESIARWQKLIETHHFIQGHARVANAMVKLGRVDEAEAYLEEPGRLYSSDLEVALMRTHLAQIRGDLAAACERWAIVRRGNPELWAGYYDGARCLADAGRHDEADTLMREAMKHFPDHGWPPREYARLAHARGDTREAAIRWISMHARFPGEDAGFRPDEAELKAAGGEAAPGRPSSG